MERRTQQLKQIFAGIALLILFAWGLEHLGEFKKYIAWFLGILEPFILGACIAFVINVPMCGIEKRLRKQPKMRPMAARVIAMLASYFLAFFIIWFVLMTVVPEVVDTVVQLNQKIPQAIKQLEEWIENLNMDLEISQYLAGLDGGWTQLSSLITQYLNMNVGDLLTSTLGVATTVVGAVTSLVIALIFSVYILAQKEKLAYQGKMLLYAYLPEKWADKVMDLLCMTSRTFSNFIAGQCTEALAFGCFIFVGMTIFRFPYAVVISVLLGFTTLIPYFGAYVGTIVGALLILVESPLQAVGFIVMVLVFQQIDNNLIYPRIVGTSVGLPGIWVIVAVTVGGSIWSVGGMLVAVPLASVLYTLLGRNVRKHLALKKVRVPENMQQKQEESKHG